MVIFVADSAMRDGPNNCVVATDGRYLGRCRLENHTIHNLGGDGCLVECENCHAWGEAYAIAGDLEDDFLTELDPMYGPAFERKSIPVTMDGFQLNVVAYVVKPRLYDTLEVNRPGMVNWSNNKNTLSKFDRRRYVRES